MTNVLVINAGSSSIKFVMFAADMTRLLEGSATEIGGNSVLDVGQSTTRADFPDHAAALAACLKSIEEHGYPIKELGAAAHRVVHGGSRLIAPCLLTADVIAEIEACCALAPLHNPHNLAAIRALAEISPSLPQFASFDTAFHATNPEVALRYAIPETAAKMGIRRYGFHGISFEGLVGQLREVCGGELPSRLLALHLGNGASLCAVCDGRSVATTMGYSPLEGLTMGTRSGSIDGNAVLRLAKEYGIEGASRILNRESGLKALGGTSDMRALRESRTSEAEFAVAHFCYWAIRNAGSMIAAMGGLDAVAITGGIGENDTGVRTTILNGLAWTGLRFDGAANAEHATNLHAVDSPVQVFVIGADEERTIAKHALANLSAQATTS
ncbi:acetate/propionate family kinase [Oricola cellulosilytica]|uniref:Acetate kinase n=1 Tax=Oricola cellulosilytica TaxID=1429082 RepID=A0A4V2MNR4_9HYPH|nr:acetate/propionate family kinase [Oricola cellulosilytica]TCD14187.1 acetate/propionate family kinase [Oricola cellulosilytica]